jgi:long-chain acyl-CoA synthetase
MTAPQLLSERARAMPDAVAFRSKHRGIYRERSWRDYASLVARCALGFRALGLLRGDRIAIMGDPCEEWMIANLAGQTVGAVTYGIYPTSSVSELKFLMRDGAATMFIAEDQEYVTSSSPITSPVSTLALHFVVVYLGGEYETKRGFSTGIVIDPPQLGSVALTNVARGISFCSLPPRRR